MDAKFSMTGKDAMKDKIARVRRGMPSEIERALYQETEIEATEVKRRTPVDRGTLRGTVHVVGPLRRGLGNQTIYTLIACGGPAAPYAIYVHEDLEAFHKVGQAKFLESVILEGLPYMGARVAKRIDLNRAAASA